MTVPLDDTSVGPAIVRILVGTGTAADEGEVRAWLEATPDGERQLKELRAIWQEAGTLHHDWNTAALQTRLLGLTRTPQSSSGAAVVPLRLGEPRRERRWGSAFGRRSRRWLSGLAAAAAVVGMVGGTVWYLETVEHGPSTVVQGPFAEIATRRGQRATLQLSDGTRVVLGVDSRLRYAEPFTHRGERNVYLEGEAYFEVARDEQRPFLVHAGETVTRVLGTQFGVRAYAEDRIVQVAVAEGKVEVGRDGVAEMRLGGGDVAMLPAAGESVVQRGVDVTSYLAWVDGRLAFTDTPVRRVVLQLARWYDLDVRLGDSSLAEIPYTIALRGDEPPDEVLQTLAAAVGGRVVRRGAAYVILPPSTAGVR